MYPWTLGISATPNVVADIVVPSPVILGILEHLGVKLPLVVMGLGAEPAPKVCSEHRFIPEDIRIFIIIEVEPDK